MSANRHTCLKFKGSTPCGTCPYRKNAPLQHWSKEEFTDLLMRDADHMGAIYGCHKKDNTVCRGWLMDQDNRNLPSIALRFSLLKNNITREYLDGLHCEGGTYNSIQEMAVANYPEVKQKI